MPNNQHTLNACLLLVDVINLPLKSPAFVELQYCIPQAVASWRFNAARDRPPRQLHLPSRRHRVCRRARGMRERSRPQALRRQNNAAVPSCLLLHVLRRYDLACRPDWIRCLVLRIRTCHPLGGGAQEHERLLDAPWAHPHDPARPSTTRRGASHTSSSAYLNPSFLTEERQTIHGPFSCHAPGGTARGQRTCPTLARTSRGCRVRKGEAPADRLQGAPTTGCLQLRPTGVCVRPHLPPPPWWTPMGAARAAAPSITELFGP